MPAIVSVLYPKGTKFDFEYYTKTHMPMVLQKWGSYGLTGYRIVKYQNGLSSFIYATCRYHGI